MEAIDYLYYGFGRVVLALALADGKVDQSEIVSLEENIQAISAEKNIDLSLVIASFDQWRTATSFSCEEMIRGGIKDFYLGDSYLTPELAEIFSEIVIDLISAEAPITKKEEEMAHSFISYLNEKGSTNG